MSKPPSRAAAGTRRTAAARPKDAAAARAKDPLRDERQTHQVERELRQHEECRAVIGDVADRQNASDMLRESGQFNAEVIANVQEGIVVYGMDQRYRVWNEYMQHFTGMKACDVLGRYPLEVFPFLEDGGVMANLASALAGGKAKSVEFQFTVGQTGRSGWALDRTSPLRNARGEIIGAISTVSDITARKRAEDALKASEQRFRDIVNTTDGMVWEADVDTLANTFMSRQAERLLGYPVESWLQPGFWAKNLHPEDRDWAIAFCSSAIKRGKPFEFEYRYLARDGRTIWLHDMVTVVRAEGVPRWLRGITVDVTARKQAEEELRDMANLLEQKVAERTAQLRQLASQLTMAEERERQALAQDLHDDLGQLLAVIKIKLSSIDAAALESSIASVVDLVSQAEQSVRTLTVKLNPPVLYSLGLVPALEWLGEEIERVYGLKVHVDHDHCRKHLV
ncbi:MAG: PAS domain S-box protein, partial [Sulfuritalea sp.]|nr:PAS domain S-box protein [Sulfuritalea sp.]